MLHFCWALFSPRAPIRPQTQLIYLSTLHNLKAGWRAFYGL